MEAIKEGQTEEHVFTCIVAAFILLVFIFKEVRPPKELLSQEQLPRSLCRLSSYGEERLAEVRLIVVVFVAIEAAATIALAEPVAEELQHQPQVQ